MADEDSKFEISIKREGGYRFTVDFQMPRVENLMVDEDPPLGKGEGPDPSRMIGAALLQCLSSSLIFCMDKSHARIDSLDGTATVRFGRNNEKRLRIAGIDIEIDVGISDEEKSKLERCKPIFEKFCTVTESVKAGIPVSLEIKTHKSD